MLKQSTGVLKQSTGVLKQSTDVLKQSTGVLKQSTGVLKQSTGVLKQSAQLKVSQGCFLTDLKIFGQNWFKRGLSTIKAYPP